MGKKRCPARLASASPFSTSRPDLGDARRDHKLLGPSLEVWKLPKYTPSTTSIVLKAHSFLFYGYSHKSGCISCWCFLLQLGRFAVFIEMLRKFVDTFSSSHELAGTWEMPSDDSPRCGSTGARAGARKCKYWYTEFWQLKRKNINRPIDLEWITLERTPNEIVCVGLID